MSKKILIVDDEPDLVAFLETLFSDNGYQAITAGDGKEGFAKAISEKPDLITLDISMPEESGVRMFRDLQDNAKTADVPVVIITGLSSDFKRFLDQLERKKKIYPPAAYFEKPIEKEELLKKIGDILK